MLISTSRTNGCYFATFPLPEPKTSKLTPPPRVEPFNTVAPNNHVDPSKGFVAYSTRHRRSLSFAIVARKTKMAMALVQIACLAIAACRRNRIRTPFVD
ncbi:cytoplasmic axial filament protein CafA and Ribonuclease G [Anopheles sinensis]|uniref:Cytoplasmic axial filament protein CafA and Ribonuclease G n=1 Tax=Anopheles sinensis TaxID=74873 RepID=A0A084WN54_ANOSI|nr:cytoplasmic axial filament protein CafA and Ribonuclease G [Anopheles sinensis]